MKPELSLSLSIETIGNGYIVGVNCRPTSGDPMGNRFPRQFCAHVEGIGDAVQTLVRQEADALEREDERRQGR